MATKKQGWTGVDAPRSVWGEEKVYASAVVPQDEGVRLLEHISDGSFDHRVRILSLERGMKVLEDRVHRAEDAIPTLILNRAGTPIGVSYNHVAGSGEDEIVTAQALTILNLRDRLEVEQGMRRDAAEKYVSDNNQLKAIIAEKNRVIDAQRRTIQDQDRRLALMTRSEGSHYTPGLQEVS